MLNKGQKFWWTVAYRHDFFASGDTYKYTEYHLQIAADALPLVLLHLDIPSHSHHLLDQQIAQARQVLIDAAFHLARARVYIPYIRTFTTDVIVASEADPCHEQVRLRQLATQLLWHNHCFLPQRKRARVLQPEEELQLARVVQTLTWQAKLANSFKNKGLILMSLLACLGAWSVGWGMLALGLTASAVTLAACSLFSRLCPKSPYG